MAVVLVWAAATTCRLPCDAADIKATSLIDVGRLSGGQHIILESFDDKSTHPDRETWLLIHGNASSPERMISLSSCIATLRENDSSQVLLLDWSDAAKSDWDAWARAEKHIDEVARLAYEKLQYLGITGENLHLVGHSFGAYVADRIAARFGRVATIIALDPATDVPDGFPFGGSATFNPRKPGTIDFAQHSDYSWSFRAADCPLGLDQTALTAHESFILAGASHGGIVENVTFLLRYSEHRLVSELFSLERLVSARRVDDLCYDSLSIVRDPETKQFQLTIAKSDAEKHFDAGLIISSDGRVTDLKVVGVTHGVESRTTLETIAIASRK